MTEFLTIRLGWKKDRSERAGYAEDMTTNEILNAGLLEWVLKASRAIECDKVIILSPDLSIIAARDIRGVAKTERNGARYEVLIWDVDEEGNPLNAQEAKDEQELLGKHVLRGTSQNPIAYVTPDRIV